MDVAWALLVALLLALSPVTGAKRLVPSIVLGLFGGGIVLLARLRRHAAAGRPAKAPALERPGIAVCAALLCTLVAFTPTFIWLYDEFTTSIWRTPHGLFVPFFVALLVRHRLRENPDATPRGSAWGFALLVPGCALVAIDAGVRSQYLALAGLLLTLPGLSLLLLGSAMTRRLVFPLALCLFLVPIPDGLGDPAGLPTLSAQIASVVARLGGLPVVRYGTYLEVPSGLVIEVSQNCSGLSFFYSGCALAALCAGVSRSWPRRCVLLASPYLLSALGNGVRVAIVLTIGEEIGLDWKRTTPFHGLLGLGVFWSVVIGVWLLADRRALREAIS